MLTRQGAIATVVSVALVVLGRLFAIFELFLVGAGGAALVIGAVVSTSLTRLRLDVSRDLRPPRIHAGEATTVTLVVANGGRRRTPVLQLRDAVGPGRTASVVLSPLSPAERITAAYTMPGEHRGVVGIGPLEVRVSDPFGLAALSVPAAPVVELRVWPLVERVMAPALTQGRDHDIGTRRDLSPSGDEFFALRPYADGDDLRRIHWRASAKRDDLVVRQDERPGQGRVAIVLDTRPGSYTDDTFERAVSAAASIAVAAARQGHILRLVTTAGHDSGSSTSRPGKEHVEAMLDQLAVVQTREVGHLATVVSTMERTAHQTGGGVVVVTGEEDPGPGERMRTPGTGLDTTVVVFTSRDSSARLPLGNGSVIVVERSTSFATAWNQAAATSSSFVAV